MGTIGPEFSAETTYDDNGRIKFESRAKYRSVPRDHTKPLPFAMEKTWISSYTPNSPVDCRNFGAGPWLHYHGSGAQARCLQAAYGKLVGKVKNLQQGWGETIATRKQGFEMILHRVGALTTAVRKLKKGDIPGFAKALGVPARRARSKVKNASSLWLEYHFGWEPLYKDIYTGCKILSADIPSGTIRGVGVEEVRETRGSHISNTYRGRVVAVLQGDYYVDNPNKYLLNQLGVINPVSVAWELVPFSFVVDWFIPVGQFLGGLTDFYGVGRRNEFTTTASFIEADTLTYYSMFDPPAFMKSHAVNVNRTLGISVPKPTFKLFRGFSVTRGATAIALLVGMLKSLK